MLSIVLVTTLLKGEPAPVVIGANGIEKILEVKLSDEEKTALKVTVEHVSGVVAETGL